MHFFGWDNFPGGVQSASLLVLAMLFKPWRSVMYHHFRLWAARKTEWSSDFLSVTGGFGLVMIIAGLNLGEKFGTLPLVGSPKTLRLPHCDNIPRPMAWYNSVAPISTTVVHAAVQARYLFSHAEFGSFDDSLSTAIADADIDTTDPWAWEHPQEQV